MTVQCHDAVEEVGVWLTGEFSGRVSATTVADVVRATRRDLEGRIATEELGEMLHRMARARLQRMLTAGDRIPRSR
ncbi:hypothetical protein ABZU76_02365 [Amycolatopsis sp. NPDC005232]|uniref:hypothetical protein n=1 Tax=Amycolatopsis sp. NPDC005232 TaxID=3157027 RepID=UPI0033AFCE73